MSGLDAGKQYQFRVRALTETFEGSFTEVIRAFAAAIPLSNPATLVESSRTTSGFMLQWSAASSPDLPVLGYKVLRDDGDNSDISVVAYDGTASPSLSGMVKLLTPGSFYRFQVYAMNAAGWS